MTWKQSLLARGGLFAMLIAILFATSALSAGQSEWVVDSFNGTDGYQPMGNLVADGAGNLYGTALEGGANNWGVVYELVRPVPPKTTWTAVVLHNFTNGTDGAQPVAGLILDKSGNLYGTASRGTSSKHGVVFELMAPAVAGGKWKEIVLHTFQPTTGDGASPVGELVWDSVGNLYGVTYTGGADQVGACVNSPSVGCGSVFQLSPPATAGGPWTETILHSFNYGQGAYPESGAILDAHGNLYGTTYVGGAYGDGVVYRLAPPTVQGGAWTYRVLHAFHPAFGSSEGENPRGALTLHGKGILYGTTTGAGANGGGTVFQLAPPASAGGAWTENILYSFGATSGDGSAPAANVIFGTAGNIFGTTTAGLAANWGTVFQLSPPASSGADWTETVLHSFGETGDGAAPSSGLLIKNGVLYGVTQSGGANGEGTVYGVSK